MEALYTYLLFFSDLKYSLDLILTFPKGKHSQKGTEFLCGRFSRFEPFCLKKKLITYKKVIKFVFAALHHWNFLFHFRSVPTEMFSAVKLLDQWKCVCFCQECQSWGWDLMTKFCLKAQDVSHWRRLSLTFLYQPLFWIEGCTLEIQVVFFFLAILCKREKKAFSSYFSTLLKYTCTHRNLHSHMPLFSSHIYKVAWLAPSLLSTGDNLAFQAAVGWLFIFFKNFFGVGLTKKKGGQGVEIRMINTPCYTFLKRYSVILQWFLKFFILICLKRYRAAFFNDRLLGLKISNQLNKMSKPFWSG